MQIANLEIFFFCLDIFLCIRLRWLHSLCDCIKLMFTGKLHEPYLHEVFIFVQQQRNFALFVEQREFLKGL